MSVRYYGKSGAALALAACMGLATGWTAKEAAGAAAATRGTGAAPAATPVPLPDDVIKKEFHFWSEGVRLAGDLYIPKAANLATEKLPVVLMCNGWGGEKNTTMARLGPIFAQHGYISMGFDYRGWGESQGKLMVAGDMPARDAEGFVTVKAREIRRVVDPLDQSEDIKAALDWLSGEPGVDATRIGLWGTSYGGGLVTWAAEHDTRVAAVFAQVSGMGYQTAGGMRSGHRLEVQQARGEMLAQPQGYGAVQGLQGFAHQSKMIYYNAAEIAEKVNVPILFVDSDKDEYNPPDQHAKKAYDKIKAKGNVPTEYITLENTTHYSVYRESFDKVTQMAVDWFDKHLKTKTGAAAAPAAAAPAAN